jgi:hypothetical protein
MRTQCNLSIQAEFLEKNEDGTYTYVGSIPIQLTSNGVSSNGPKIMSGNTLIICKNQYTESTSELRMHAFFDVDSSHAQNCACGVCGSSFRFLPASAVECNCEKASFRNQMDEPCTIM